MMTSSKEAEKIIDQPEKIKIQAKLCLQDYGV